MKKIFLLVVAFSLLLAGTSDAAGVSVQKLLFADQIAGLGQYTPRSGNRFTLDDTCRLYLEVAGFAMPLTLNTQDEFNVNVAVDVKVKLPQSGRRIAFQPEMAKLNSKVRTKLSNHFFTFGFGFDGWSPGNYVLEVGVRDVLGGQTVSQDIPFTLAEPTEADIKARKEREAQEKAAEQTPPQSQEGQPAPK